MPAPCATCGAPLNASIHVAKLAGSQFHKYTDATAPGMNDMSKGRRAYRERTSYSERSAAAREQECAFFAAGAPVSLPGFGTCPMRAQGMHHIMPLSRAGGLPAAERYPTVPACNAHNGWATQSAEGMRWSEAHTWWDEDTGKVWPFLLSMKGMQS